MANLSMQTTFRYYHKVLSCISSNKIHLKWFSVEMFFQSITSLFFFKFQEYKTKEEKEHMFNTLLLALYRSWCQNVCLYLFLSFIL